MHIRERVEKATESTMARTFTRFGLPVMVALIGWFMRGELADIKDAQRDAAAKQQKTSESVSRVESDVRVINVRLDVQVINRLGELEKKFAEFEKSQNVK